METRQKWKHSKEKSKKIFYCLRKSRRCNTFVFTFKSLQFFFPNSFFYSILCCARMFEIEKSLDTERYSYSIVINNQSTPLIIRTSHSVLWVLIIIFVYCYESFILYTYLKKFSPFFQVSNLRYSFLLLLFVLSLRMLFYYWITWSFYELL